MLSYALFAYGLPRGRVFQSRIEGFEGVFELTTDSSNVTRAIRTFTHPDVESSEKATAVALGEKLKRRVRAPRDTTVTVLNGNGVAGSASTAGFLLGERGYQILTPPNGLPANAPRFDYFRTQVYYAGKVNGAREAAEKVTNLFGSAETKRLPAEISQLANGAMLTVVVGQTFHGTLAAAAIDQTPRREKPNVVFAPSASRDLLRERRSRVRFPLMVPTVIERSSWTDSTMPVRMYWIDPDEKHKAVRLVYRMGSNEYWGVQMTDWDDAPVLADKSLTRRIKGRIYDLYFDGPKLHMVVPAHEARAVLGGQLVARPAVQRDDARNRQGPEAAGEREVALGVRVAVFGAGYVGLVTGACLADLGHDVVVRDIVSEKIDALRRGEVPIHEEGLAELLEQNRRTADVHDRGRRRPRGSGRRLRRRRYTADRVRRRRPDRGLDRRRRAAARRAQGRPGHEEHGPGRNRQDRPSPAGRARPRERRLRLESGVHGRGHRVRDFMHPDRIVIGSFDPADGDARGAAARRHRRPRRPRRRRVRRDDQACRERRPRHAHLVHQRDRERLRGDRRGRAHRRRGNRPRPPDRPVLPAGGHRLRRLVLPEGLAGAEAARRQLRATASSS